MGIGSVNLHGNLVVKPGQSVSAQITGTVTPSAIAAKDVLLITPANSGDPSELYEFTNAETPRTILGTGYVPEDIAGDEKINPCKLIECLMDPVKNPELSGAFRVKVKRVGKPTRAQWIILNESLNPLITANSADYGLGPNSIKIRSIVGDVVKNGRTIYVKDNSTTRMYANLGRMLRVLYNGSGTAATCVIEVDSQDHATRFKTYVDGTLDLNIDLTSINAIGGLVGAINRATSYSAMIDTKCDPSMPVYALDPITVAMSIKQIDVSSATSVAANSITKTGAFAGMNLVGRWVNPNTTDSSTVRVRVVSHTDDSLTFEGLVDLTTITAAGKNFSVLHLGCDALSGSVIWSVNRGEQGRIVLEKHANAIGTTYECPALFDYSGPTTPGTYPAITTQDWSDAFSAVSRQFRQNGALMIGSTSHYVHLMADTYCREQYEIYARDIHWFAGPEIGVESDEAIGRVLEFNSIIGTWVYQGARLYNDDGVLALYPSLYHAAMVCGLYAGSGLRKPVTGCVLKTYGLEFEIDDQVEEDLIKSGATVISRDPMSAVKQFVPIVCVTTATDQRAEFTLLSAKARIFEVNQLLKVDGWKYFYGQFVTDDVKNAIETSGLALMDRLTGGQYPYFAANPGDPTGQPAFTPPVFTMTQNSGKTLWSGRLIAEGLYLDVSGMVEYRKIDAA